MPNDEQKVGFTKGPWKIFGPDQRYPGIESTGDSIIIFGNQYDCAGVQGETHAESLANARLIAAAPEMYEMLGKIVDGPLVKTDDIYALLGKIEGEE